HAVYQTPVGKGIVDLIRGVSNREPDRNLRKRWGFVFFWEHSLPRSLEEQPPTQNPFQSTPQKGWFLRFELLHALGNLSFLGLDVFGRADMTYDIRFTQMSAE